MKINHIYHGNALTLLRQIPDNSIDCCITSPPYYGLRDYQTAPIVWGGEQNCKHDFEMEKATLLHENRQNLDGGTIGNDKFRKELHGFGNSKSGFCSKCEAWNGSLGLEPTPELFIEHLTEIFEEVRRTLKPTGTLWLNIGDSYAGNPAGNKIWGDGVGSNKYYQKNNIHQIIKKKFKVKQKDLIGIPWMLAFALRKAGWYLRMDIIWHKPNPMPESVQDRPTKSHEYIFLLSKNSKYYYDYQAILEPANYDGRTDTFFKGSQKYLNGFAPAGTSEQSFAKKGHERWSNKIKKPYAVVEKEFRKEIIEYRDLPPQEEICKYLKKARERANKTISQIEDVFGGKKAHHWFEFNGSYPTKDDWTKLKEILDFDEFYDKQMTTIYLKSGMKQNHKIMGRTEKKMEGTGYGGDGSGLHGHSGYFDGDGNPRFNIKDGIPARNKRSVWTVTTKPYSEAHFATFPENLIVDCIKAGCPEEVCNKCGKPREKIIDSTEKINAQWGERKSKPWFNDKRKMPQKEIQNVISKVIGLTDCGCCAPCEPGIVLDPFMGAGTTAIVARKLNRNYLGIELNEQYIKIAKSRMSKELGMFA